MGLSRNKVAVSEGAAGSPPFYGERVTGQTMLLYSLTKNNDLTKINLLESQRKELSHFLFLYVSTELSSRTVSRKVFSPLQSLTSVFGMGTGGPSAFVALTILSNSLSLNIEQQSFPILRISPSIV